MNHVITTERIPIKLWLSEMDDIAMEQAKHLANLPFAFKHIAIMPDAHAGYGMPVGGVLATDDVIIPNAVGVDIGCGMMATRTNLEEIDIDSLKRIMRKIRRQIPVGFNHHKDPQPAMLLPKNFTERKIVKEQFEAARCQLGTLGGGNHFIEIQKGSDGFIWIMIHSGSRNVGKKVADYYNKLAAHLNEKWAVSVPKEWQLAFLPMTSKEGIQYLQEMQWCVSFALRNRNHMMSRIVNIFCEEFNKLSEDLAQMTINIAHNYAEVENHFGKDVVVHRKGATKAISGGLGIIPGSQGSSSYIVIGKSNPLSFNSCSHGAGRVMGRRQARESLSLEEEKANLDSRGILHSIRSAKDLDEAPGAYKDISEVMKNQEDLVEIAIELEPLAVVKG